MAPLIEAGFLAPLPPLLVAVLGATLLRDARRPGSVAELGALLALGLSAFSLADLLLTGSATLALGTTAVSFHIEPIGATLQLLIAFVGWVVVRYARTYLAGARGESRFHVLLLATLSAVLALSVAASLPALILAFMAIGTLLRRLLLFFPARPAARRAATKFTLVWGAADVALVLAAALLWISFGDGGLTGIDVPTQSGLPVLAQFAVALVVLAAALKTAAFPLHGWVTEVMEAPTPVSAFLHAGIINSGGVLLIKLAPLVGASPGAMAALVMVGGFTALFGATVMLTQSAVKTALAWSTVAQMGFMLLQCGLGLWPLALLHIVAHSLYKAHAFLSSGSAVLAVASVRRPGPVAVPGTLAVARAFLLALGLYAVVALAFDLLLGAKSAQALALGAILVLGVAYLVAQGLADAAPRALTRRTVLASLGATLAYFGFHRLADWLWGGLLPGAPLAGPLEWALIVLALASFALVAIVQAMFPLWAHHPAAAGLRVHLANGLYLNAILDRLTGGFRADAKP
ncbi:MAG: oxidoreductase [Devosia sp.]|nr:oxidoreductase [Devosia sp.]